MHKAQRGARDARANIRLVVRLVGGIAALTAMLALLSGVGTANAAPEKVVHKSYVCKYVDKPGEAERLQTGQNPIWVDNHSLFRSPQDYNAAGGLTHVGQQFNDKQVKSVVIVANTDKLTPEPSVSQCPGGPTTTTSTTTKTTTTTSSSSTSSSSSSSHPSTPSSSSSSGTSGTSGTNSGGGSGGATPAAQATSYGLQPVNAGAADGGSPASSGLSLVQGALAVVVLLGLWLLATGGRLFRLTRLGSGGGHD